MKKLLWMAALGLAVNAGAQPLHLGLEESVSATLAGSHLLKAARLDAEAAAKREAASQSQLWPRLSADGSYRYVQQVPSVKLSPQAPAAKFGDNNNYSLGLVAQWDVFSWAATWRQWETARELVKARQEEALNQEQALRLRARLAYFQTRAASSKAQVYGNALKLAQEQAADLALRLKTGTSSRIDALAASNEELDRRAQFRAAQADLAGALRELLALTGLAKGADVSMPVPDAMGDSLPAEIEAPSVQVGLDPSAELLALLEPEAAKSWDPAAQPRLKALRAQVEAARAQAALASSGHWPRGSVSAKQSLDYPNGPVLEQVNQSTLAANVSLPLYSFGGVSAQVDEQEALARAAGEREAAAVTDMEKDWLKAKDRLAALRVQRELGTKRAEQAQVLQQLVYKAYKVGGANYLEVQSSSLRSLQAGLELTGIETQMLIELANLAALTGPQPSRLP